MEKGFATYFLAATREDACSYLNRTYGIEIKESDSLTAVCVRFEK